MSPNRPTRLGSPDLAAAILLAVLFIAFTARSWLAWGHLSSDYGREMYVPMRLALGDLPYKDVRWPYGPFSPYLHALAYWSWKPHLAVLYASGLTSVALAVTALYLTGRSFASVPAVALGSALTMVDVMFKSAHPGFSFVLPYAYPSTHGILFVLIALAAVLRLIHGGGYRAAVVGGTAIGLSLLTKHEFGAVGLGIAGLTCAGLILVEGFVSARGRLATLLGLALGIPLLGYGTLALFMPVSTIYHRAFYDSDYFGWPITWLIAGLKPGMSPGEVARFLAGLFAESIMAYVWVALGVLGAALAFASNQAPPVRRATRAIGIVLLVGATWQLAPPLWASFASGSAVGLNWRYLSLPLLLFLWLLVEGGFAAYRWWRGEGFDAMSIGRSIVVAASLVLLLRVVAKVIAHGYANFYLAPAILLAAHLVVDLMPQFAGTIGGNRRAGRAAALTIVITLLVAVGAARYREWGSYTVPLVTERGTMYRPRSDPWVPAFRAALDVIEKETEPNATLLALPTETALYFLSGRANRLYETSIITTVQTEAAEHEFISALEADPPDLVLLSNRNLAEYGRGRFGKDFTKLIDAWIRENYTASVPPLGRAVRIQVWKPRTSAGPAGAPGSAQQRG